MGLGISKNEGRATKAAIKFERRQFAILFLWEGYALLDDECARVLAMSAITHLAEMRA